MKAVFIFILYLVSVLGYSDYDRVLSKEHHLLTEKDAAILIQKIVDLSKESNLGLLPVKAIFFAKERKSSENNVLIALVKDDYYLITKEKTYIVSDLAQEIDSAYQFVYYVMDGIDMSLEGVTVFGLEEIMQGYTHKHLIDLIVYIFTK